MSTACISNVMQADIPLMLYFSLEVLIIFQMCTRVSLKSFEVGLGNVIEGRRDLPLVPVLLKKMNVICNL